METFIFQHVEFEGPGAILPILEAKGHRIHRVNLYAGDAVPDSSAVDFAVLMGGPMSALDEDKFPFLSAEKQFCREMFAANKPLLGICLGAQLLANAFYAPIRKNPEKEIGWFPVTFENGLSLNAFHWHGETFDIPEYAVPLAYSEACKNQGFKIGRSVGLQFHLETTAESMKSILENCADELNLELSNHRQFVQTKPQILELGKRYIPQANIVLNELLNAILG